MAENIDRREAIARLFKGAGALMFTGAFLEKLRAEEAMEIKGLNAEYLSQETAIFFQENNLESFL